MTKKVLLLPGDGIGPEIVAQAENVLIHLIENFDLDVELDTDVVGGAAYDLTETPLPEQTLNKALQADAVLLGAVGGHKWEPLEREVRPEKALLDLRSRLELFANLRPAMLYPQLVNASSLKRDRIENLDLMIIRELTGGIYFGEPRGVFEEGGERVGINTYRYSESEIERIAHVGFKTAQLRNGRLCSVDKANVLEVTELWREVVTEVGKEYPDVELSHMYVDNAAMQLVRAPKQFDVIVTGNMFGDILSDVAAMLTGSIGMLPSASLDSNGKGLYEPVHGSAPDIAGQNKANPLATIMSVSLMLRYSLNRADLANRINLAVENVLGNGARTFDIAEGETYISTTDMGEQVVTAIK
ncbi:3-isopropylmalate dehydrogenase [Pleionea sediminis]|uniref:3-isopropylmalate dehydrogenase n=1 Tax=Pleionea sediminis TaxID=2569479 RepID=UPI0011861B59|nr:3-isopropylmalate dehydrogenase [Pleionea sediminis]